MKHTEREKCILQKTQLKNWPDWHKWNPIYWALLHWEALEWVCLSNHTYTRPSQRSECFEWKDFLCETAIRRLAHKKNIRARKAPLFKCRCTHTHKQNSCTWTVTCASRFSVTRHTLDTRSENSRVRSVIDDGQRRKTKVNLLSLPSSAFIILTGVQRLSIKCVPFYCEMR